MANDEPGFSSPSPAPPPSPLSSWLRTFVSEMGGVAGTVHVRQDDSLRLGAAVNIPPKVAAIVELVPRGKGMAGLAFERDETVQTCNLKTDSSGDVRPGAQAVEANAAAAIPIHDAAGAVRGIVGIAFMGEREIGAEELRRLAEKAEAAPV